MFAGKDLTALRMAAGREQEGGGVGEVEPAEGELAEGEKEEEQGGGGGR